VGRQSTDLEKISIIYISILYRYIYYIKNIYKLTKKANSSIKVHRILEQALHKTEYANSNHMVIHVSKSNIKKDIQGIELDVHVLFSIKVFILGNISST
jgi:hypothetical protein